MTSQANKVKLKDIASEIGVSLMTVSQVLNPRKNSVRVSVATKEKVLAAAKRLNYRPNLVARQLAGTKEKIIGIIIDSQAAVVWQRTLAVIERIASEHNYRLQVGLVHDKLDSIKKYTDDFLGYGIDNLICFAHRYPEFGEKVADVLKPFPNCVFIDQPMGKSKAAYVKSDYYSTCFEAVEYLLNLNRKRVIFARMGAMDSVFGARSRAFEDAFKKHDLEYDKQFFYDKKLPGLYNYTLAEEFIEDVLPLKPDTLVVGSDESAMWCCKVLSDKKIKVPEEISILSCSRWSLGGAFSPAITAIDYDYEQIAKKAMEIIMNNVAKLDSGRKIEQIKEYVKAKLVIADSCCRKSVN